MVWLSYSISGVVLVVAAALQWRVIGRGGENALSPPGMDLLAKSFLDCLPPASAPFLSFLIWLFVSLFVEIGGPILAGRIEVVDTWLQKILALIYCVLAPLLLGCYVYLARSLREVIERPVSLRHRRRLGGFILLQSVICAAALANQASTILIQTTPATATPPILWADALTWQLNWQGAAHAALRGLDGLMAIGLVCTTAMMWARKEAIGGLELLEHRGVVKSAIRRCGIGLTLAIALASLVVWLHLATILEHRAEASPEPPAFAQFVTSGWVLWVAGWIIAAIFASNIFFSLHRRAAAEQQLNRRHQTDQIAQISPKPIQMEDYKPALENRAKVLNEQERASPWAVPPWLFLGIIVISVVVEPVLAGFLPVILR